MAVSSARGRFRLGIITLRIGWGSRGLMITGSPVGVDSTGK
jgi:hypothetical protein